MHSYVADLTIEGFIFDKCLRNWSGFGIFVGDTTFELKNTRYETHPDSSVCPVRAWQLPKQ